MAVGSFPQQACCFSTREACQVQGLGQYSLLTSCFLGLMFFPGLPRVLLQVLQDPGWDHCCCHVPHLGGRSWMGQACLSEEPVAERLVGFSHYRSRQESPLETSGDCSAQGPTGAVPFLARGLFQSICLAFVISLAPPSEGGKNSIYIPWENTALAGRKWSFSGAPRAWKVKADVNSCRLCGVLLQ